MSTSKSTRIWWKKKPFWVELFYRKIAKKRNINEEIRIEADEEFEQSEIKRLNKKYNIVTYVSTKIQGGEAFSSEQKIRELKKNCCLKLKQIEKRLGNRITVKT